MKLDPCYLVEQAVSKDETRRIASAHLDVEGKRVLATDGRILASVPVEVTTFDRSGPVPAAALSAARKGDVSARRRLIGCGDALYRRGEDGHFPPVRPVLPKFQRGDEGTVTVALDPRLLLALAQAIGVGTHGGVTLTFQPAPHAGRMLDAVLVLNDGSSSKDDGAAFGVLMPRRWS